MTLADDEAMKTMTIVAVKRRITLTDDHPRKDTRSMTKTIGKTPRRLLPFEEIGKGGSKSLVH